MTSMIVVHDLVKLFGARYALGGLTFEIPKGQVVGFLGPNGAGKSTTMRILTGYIPQTSGDVRVAGLSVADNPVAIRRHIGYLPENNPLYEDMMVIEYLRYVAQARALTPEQSRKGLRECVERCGLGDVLGQDTGTLSKGYRQRVGLAAAILHNPDLLILDEPTSGLDPNQIVDIRALIRELGQDKTILMSTHILGEVQSTCSRVLIINEGKLVADDPTELLMAKDSGTVYLTVAARNSEQLLIHELEKVLRMVPGVTHVQARAEPAAGVVEVVLRHQAGDVRPALFDSVVEQGLVLLEMRKKEMSLEEVFRKLTGDAKQEAS